jgi:hypothetical protein
MTWQSRGPLALSGGQICARRLALLAPDIVEAILAGRTDQVLMLEQPEGRWRQVESSMVSCQPAASRLLA